MRNRNQEKSFRICGRTNEPFLILCNLDLIMIKLANQLQVHLLIEKMEIINGAAKSMKTVLLDFAELNYKYFESNELILPLKQPPR